MGCGGSHGVAGANLLPSTAARPSSRKVAMPMSLSFPGFMLLLSPLLVTIVIMRPSWLEFLLLILPFVAAILVALFAFGAAKFLGLGLIGLLILLCAITFEADARDLIGRGGVSTALLERITQARDTPSERAARQGTLKAQSRQLRLARLIGAECAILSLIAWLVLM
jgi:hypothetical protein